MNNEGSSKITEFSEWLKSQQSLALDGAAAESIRSIQAALSELESRSSSSSSVPRPIPNSPVIGKSQTVLDMLSMVDKIAPTQATVLIQGESGTGKELVARQLHVRSGRAHAPYVTVNCGALQETLLESELFGHEKGSFTGAVTQKVGLVETADKGTLFLDEIGELSPAIQTKLLRFLQEGEFYRVGGKKPMHVDVRVVSATNRDLATEVKQGRFREDLFYRLNTITLTMPALRERSDDIPLLIRHFLRQSRVVDSAALEALQAYRWPGNIRELQNAVERISILSDGPIITLKDIPENIRQPNVTATSLKEMSVNTPLEEIEKAHILRTLTFNRGNKTRTAQKLGITIKTLYNKLHRYGVIEPQAQANGRVEQVVGE